MQTVSWGCSGYNNPGFTAGLEAHNVEIINQFSWADTITMDDQNFPDIRLVNNNTRWSYSIY